MTRNELIKYWTGHAAMYRDIVNSPRTDPLARPACQRQIDIDMATVEHLQRAPADDPILID